MRIWRTTSVSPSKRSVLIEQRRRGARRRQIDEHARRVRDPLVVERDFGVELDGDAHGVGQHGAADAADGRDPGARWIRRRRSARATRRARASIARRISDDAAGLRRGAAAAGHGRIRSAREISPETCLRELARRIAASASAAKQADARRLVLRLAEARERVERQTARLPERVVAVAARGIPPHDRFVRRRRRVRTSRSVAGETVLERERGANAPLRARARRRTSRATGGAADAGAGQRARRATRANVRFAMMRPALTAAARPLRRSTPCRRAPRAPCRRRRARRGLPSPSCRRAAPRG